MDNVRVLYTYDEFIALDEDIRVKYFEMISLLAEPHMKIIAVDMMGSALHSFLSSFYKKD